MTYIMAYNLFYSNSDIVDILWIVFEGLYIRNSVPKPILVDDERALLSDRLLVSQINLRAVKFATAAICYRLEGQYTINGQEYKLSIYLRWSLIWSYFDNGYYNCGLSSVFWAHIIISDTMSAYIG